MNRGFTDIHQHIVFGMDDGANSMSDSIAMLNLALKNNINTIIATPHVVPGVKPFDYGLYAQRLSGLQAYCRDHNLPIRLLQGAEIFYTDLASKFLQERRVPTVGNTNYVLVEFAPDIGFDSLQRSVRNLLRNGYMPVIAHVERYSCVMRSTRRAEELKEGGDVLFQMNCETLLKAYNPLKRHLIWRLIDQGLIDMVASDAHNTEKRPPKMREAYLALKSRYDENYAGKLTGYAASSEFMKALFS